MLFPDCSAAASPSGGGKAVFRSGFAVAYLLQVYVFLTGTAHRDAQPRLFCSPFCLLPAGILRLGSGLRQMSQARGWLNIIIGLLDLFIALPAGR